MEFNPEANAAFMEDSEWPSWIEDLRVHSQCYRDVLIVIERYTTPPNSGLCKAWAWAGRVLSESQELDWEYQTPDKLRTALERYREGSIISQGNLTPT
jgi:hypothetical protein